MIEINHNFFFFANLVITTLIFISCFKIAYIWKKRKLLSTNFFLLGMTYSFVFFSLVLWSYTHSLFALTVGNILLFIWTISFSIGTFILLFPKKSPLAYAPLIYTLIPLIYLYTRDIEMTFIMSLDLSGVIIMSNFIRLLFFGKKLIKIASIPGTMMLLVRIIYAFSLSTELNNSIYASPIYMLMLNIFLAVSFISFWHISKNKPEHFFNMYDPKIDGK